MAVRLPGTIGLMLRRFTPEFRYDIALAGGHLMFGAYFYPQDLVNMQEMLTIVDRSSFAPPLDAVVYATLRLEPGGTVIVILQSSVFGFCVVRRTNETLAVNQWQRVDVICATAVNDCHVYIDGVEATYSFSRSEALLPPAGGSDILFGSNFRGDGVSAPHYPCGTRLFSGDPLNGDIAKRFTTSPGTFFTGGIAHAGFWHAGAPADPGVVLSLGDGFSPSFMQHYLESSSVSVALMMCPGLYGDGNIDAVAYNPEEEFDPKSGIKLEYTIGSGVGTWIDGPGVCEPCFPEIEGPGPIVSPGPRLCLPFGLPRAENFPSPANPADLLPIVYGDFRVGGVSGPIPSTLVNVPDPDNPLAGPDWVYCGAFHPVVSVEKVYIGDVEQTFTFDTIDPLANIVVSLGSVQFGVQAFMSITFRPDASNRMLSPEGQPIQPVSWRGRGLADETGLVVMENCIDQLVHLLTTWGNFDLEEDFDPTTLAESRSAVEDMGYKTAFVIFDLEVTQDWITEMLFNVMGYWRINGLEQVEFHIDVGAVFSQQDILASIIASRDCVDGDDGVAFVIDREHLVNKLTAYYLWNYAGNQASSRLDDLIDDVSLAAYGAMEKAVTLKGLRRAEDVVLWAAILLARQSARTRVEGGMIQATLQGGKFAHLTIGDMIAFSWAYGPTREDGNEYVNEILRIVNITSNPTRGGTMELIAVDLGLFILNGGVRLTTPVAL